MTDLIADVITFLAVTPFRNLDVSATARDHVDLTYSQPPPTEFRESKESIRFMNAQNVLVISIETNYITRARSEMLNNSASLGYADSRGF
jgi:hypothetical protein